MKYFKMHLNMSPALPAVIRRVLLDVHLKRETELIEETKRRILHEWKLVQAGQVEIEVANRKIAQLQTRVEQLR